MRVVAAAGIFLRKLFSYYKIYENDAFQLMFISLYGNEDHD